MDQPDIQPAKIVTQGNLLTWNMVSVAPESSQYVTLDDVIYVRSVCSVTGVILRVRARILLLNGQVVSYEFDHSPNSNRTVLTTSRPAAEGFLLSCTVFCDNVTLKRGQCYVNVGLARSTVGDFTPVQSFIGDYVVSAFALAYPGGTIQSPTEGHGNVRSIAGTIPGAGAEISETVPTGARWRLIHGRFSFTASAAVANRAPTLVITDGVNFIFQMPNPGTLSANGVGIFNFSTGMGVNTTPNTIFPLPLSADVFMPAGFRFQTSTISMQAGDTWTTNQYQVEEWLEL